MSQSRSESDEQSKLDARHAPLDELEAALDIIRQSPCSEGVVRLIVRRPAIGERQIVLEAELDQHSGLVGDNWLSRGSRHTPDGRAHPDAQLTIMNARAIAAIARQPERWPLAGDQLFVDMDLSDENLPAGTKLAVGSAVVEVTAEPHTGCKQFATRFGSAAVKFVNSPVGRQLRLRGINAKIVQGGTVRQGEVVRRL